MKRSGSVPRRTAAMFLAAPLVCTGGCARALREPPPLKELARADVPTSPAEVGALLSRAEALFATREIASVREASDLWLRAAAADPSRVEGLAGAARAHVWLTERETEPADRERAAVAAVQVAQWCGRIAPDDARCAYWLGAALGLQALEKPSTGLSALPKIEEAFRKAAALDPLLDRGGPDRALVLLYLRAPGWPTGPGDPDLALEHARRAVEIAPDHPPNQLGLAEALEKTGDGKGAREAALAARHLAARLAAAGDPDAAEWAREAETALARLGGM